MLTKKALVSTGEGVLTPNVAGWVARNAVPLKGKFAKKFPRSRNLFNIQVLDTTGSKRTVILKAGNVVAIDRKNSYKNVISFSELRKMGCPTA